MPGLYKISINEYQLDKDELVQSWSEWVIKFNGLSGDSGQRGPYSRYKPCNHSLYIEDIIFPNIDNTQSTGHN